MKPPVDLHIHSKFSDGINTPEELCALAVRSGIRFLALSDHDTTDGLPLMRQAVTEQNQAGNELTFFPAIELSSGENGVTHILGYGVTPVKEPLQSELNELKRKRVARIAETIRRLNRLLGTEFRSENVLQSTVPHPVPGRMHVARLLMASNYVQSVSEAFDRYLGVGKPAYIPLKHISSEEAVKLLLQSHAVPVLAHPMRLQQDKAALEELVICLKACGLMGIEAYHPSASRMDAQWLAQLARRYDLLVTGGSDYHGEGVTQARLRQYPSGWNKWRQDIDFLATTLQATGRKQIEGEP